MEFPNTDKQMEKGVVKNTNEEQTRVQKIGGLLCFFLFSVVALTFAILILTSLQEKFVVKYRVLLIVAVVLLIVALTIAGCIFYAKKKTSIFRILTTAAFLVAFFAVVYYVLLKSGFLKLINDPEEYKQFLESSGGWMALVYILLQYLQVIVLPIPSFVSTLAGVALFGPLLATVYSLIGIMLGSLTAFFIGRKFGYKAVAWMIGKEDLEKWQAKLKGKDNFILTAMFLLPLFPDDVLCFIAGLSSMSNRYFVIMMLICRIIGVTATCYSIQILPFNTWWGLLGWGVIYAVVIVGFILFYKNIDKINAWIQRRKKQK